MSKKKKKKNNNNERKSTAQPRPVLNVPPLGIRTITDDPNENEVLCGRGRHINNHAGNVQFRNMIHSKKKEYLLAPSTKKLEKAHIAASIVNDIRTMHPPGRFLMEERGTGMWFAIGVAKAMKKTGHALREDAPDVRAAIDGSSVSSGEEHTRIVRGSYPPVGGREDPPSHPIVRPKNISTSKGRIVFPNAFTKSRSSQPATAAVATTAAADDEYSITDALGPYDIICGRGSVAYNNGGNRRFRVLIGSNVEKYKNIVSRHRKGTFIVSLIHTITQKMGGKFYKLTNNNTFTELTETQSRVKVGHALRDCSSTFEKSQLKQPREQQQQQQKKQQQQQYEGDGNRNDTNKDKASVPKQTRQQQQRRRPSLVSQQQQLLPQLSASTSTSTPPRVLRFVRTSSATKIVQQVLLVPRDIGDDKTVHDAMVVAQQRKKSSICG